MDVMAESAASGVILGCDSAMQPGALTCSVKDGTSPPFAATACGSPGVKIGPPPPSTMLFSVYVPFGFGAFGASDSSSGEPNVSFPACGGSQGGVGIAQAAVVTTHEPKVPRSQIPEPSAMSPPLTSKGARTTGCPARANDALK